MLLAHQGHQPGAGSLHGDPGAKLRIQSVVPISYRSRKYLMGATTTRRTVFHLGFGYTIS